MKILTLLCFIFGINCTEKPVETEPNNPLDGKHGKSGITAGEDGEAGQDARD